MANLATRNQPESIRYSSREPILTATQKVIGYKLFFRSAANQPMRSDLIGEQLDALYHVSSLVGLNTLSDRRLAFLTCSHQSLVENHILLLPAERAVLEIPRTVPATEEVLAICHRLKQAGYRIALECVTRNDPRESLFELADFLKISIHDVPTAEIESMTSHHRPRRTRLLADRVETWDDFQRARSAGFQYFQGHFFRRPETQRAHRVGSIRAIGLRLLQTIHKPSLDWYAIEDTLKRDATLSYRLLRYLNSAAFGLRSEVHSIRQALTLLGEDEFRRWCRLAIFLDTAQNRPSDLVLSALNRARFAELIGLQLNSADTDLFLLGLLSLMDAILEIPMTDVLDGLPLGADIRTALVDHQGPLALVFDLVLAIESGAWGSTVRLCEALHLDPDRVAAESLQAMEWAQMLLTPA